MKQHNMKVYVVLEADRGNGTSVQAIFTKIEDARAYLSGPDGSGCYLDSEYGIEILSHKGYDNET